MYHVCVCGIGGVGGYFGGTIIRMGKKLGVPVPVTEEVYALL